MGDLRRDLDKYHRSLRIQCHFNKQDETEVTGPSIGPFSDMKSLKIKSNSKWSPPMGPNNLETIVSVNELGLLDMELTRPKASNVTQAQKASISELLSNKNIVIKPADKGGATVIQCRSRETGHKGEETASGIRLDTSDAQSPKV